MKVSCKYCLSYHDRGFECAAKTKRIKSQNHITKFRNSQAWKRKSQAIRKRDNWLCQLCLIGYKMPTIRYESLNLEVHHIVSLASNFDLRLDDHNLITLCRSHHAQADEGKIEREELFEMVKKINWRATHEI